MNALMYVFFHDAKNKFFDLRRKPGKIVMYALITALMVWVVVMSILQPPTGQEHTDIAWLKAIATGLFLFSVIIAIKQGLSKGTTLFAMEDVNNLFVSPLNPRGILLFGVAKMMKTAALSSIFILFNSMTLRDMFGVYFGGVMIFFAAFVLVTAVSQVMTLVIYSFTNSRPRRQKIVKAIVFILFAPMVISLLWNLVSADFDIVVGFLEFMRTPISSFIPIAGWAAAGSLAFIAGDIAGGALFFGMLVATGAIFISAIYIGKPDYYEDVLVATETAFEKVRAVAEGDIGAATLSEKSVKVKATGVGGYGASAIFHRHIREAFRTNRFGLWGTSTLVLVVLAMFNSFIMARAGGGDENTSALMLTVLIMMMIVQVFLVSSCRGEKDTYSHYVYMIPEKPFKKMIWSNLEGIFKITVQNTLVFIASGIILGADVPFIILAIVTCTLFAFMSLGVSWISMRFTGSHMSMGILLMLYFLAIIIVVLPGAVGAVIVGSIIGGHGGLIVGLLILSAWELIAGIGCFAASKGVLHNCDVPTMSKMMQAK